ncbi:MAG: hypothetical protein V7739_12695 [Motiliproteus sp.]
MSHPVRCTNCSLQGMFIDELKRLSARGLTPSRHADIQRLDRGEFLIHRPLRTNKKGTVSVYYRE